MQYPKYDHFTYLFLYLLLRNYKRNFRNLFQEITHAESVFIAQKGIEMKGNHEFPFLILKISSNQHRHLAGVVPLRVNKFLQMEGS